MCVIIDDDRVVSASCVSRVNYFCRLTAAGREHCEWLIEELVGPAAADEDAANEPPSAAADDPVPVDDIQPSATLREDWPDELLSAAEVAERLEGDVDAEALTALRRDSSLLGLISGSRENRRIFYPTFQIDTENRRIHPEVRRVNKLLGSSNNSWDAADWWKEIQPELGARPMDLVGTPRAAAVVRAAEAKFAR